MALMTTGLVSSPSLASAEADEGVAGHVVEGFEINLDRVLQNLDFIGFEEFTFFAVVVEGDLVVSVAIGPEGA